jgi:hypothetical protein
VKEGDTHHRWTVIADNPRIVGKGIPMWACRCECGTVKEVNQYSLSYGTSRSCGCLKSEESSSRFTAMLTKHGKTETREYNIWQLMLKRCYDPSNHKYPDYGGRGIAVCERWRNSFVAFLEDTGNAPSPQHSIDRFPDNDGNYEPGNTRWATPKQQARNRRSSKLVEFDGATRTIAEWAEVTGLSYDTIQQRLASGRWSIEKALTTPRMSNGKRERIGTGYHIKESVS